MISYLAEAHRDTSETSYTTVFSEVFSTKEDAEKALRSVWADLKYVREIKVNCAHEI